MLLCSTLTQDSLTATIKNTLLEMLKTLNKRLITIWANNKTSKIITQNIPKFERQMSPELKESGFATFLELEITMLCKYNIRLQHQYKI